MTAFLEHPKSSKDNRTETWNEDYFRKYRWVVIITMPAGCHVICSDFRTQSCPSPQRTHYPAQQIFLNNAHWNDLRTPSAYCSLLPHRSSGGFIQKTVSSFLTKQWALRFGDCVPSMKRITRFNHTDGNNIQKPPSWTYQSWPGGSVWLGSVLPVTSLQWFVFPASCYYSWLSSVSIS